MLEPLKIITLLLIISGLTACGGGSDDNATANTDTTTIGTDSTTTVTDNTTNTDGTAIDTNAALLGKQLFSDTRLSFNQTQSCATCHNPDR